MKISKDVCNIQTYVGKTYEGNDKYVVITTQEGAYKPDVDYATYVFVIETSNRTLWASTKSIKTALSNHLQAMQESDHDDLVAS